jgi:hypothetical protein
MYRTAERLQGPYEARPERVVTTSVDDVKQVLIARARAMIEELGIHKTLAELQTLPAIIGECERGILEIQQRMEDVERQRLTPAKDAANMAELMALSSAPEEATNGKNAEIRSQALKRHLAQDVPLIQAQREVRGMEAKIADLAGQIEVLEVVKRKEMNLFRALCIIAESQKEMLSIYAQALK